jgi:hypothetical protein
VAQEEAPAAGGSANGGGDVQAGAGHRQDSRSRRALKCRREVADLAGLPLIVELIELADGSRLIDVRRWRRRPDGQLVATRRGLAIRLDHAPALLDAIATAVARAT